MERNARRLTAESHCSSLEVRPTFLPSSDASAALAESVALCLGLGRSVSDTESAQLPPKHIASFGIAVPNVNVSNLPCSAQSSRRNQQALMTSLCFTATCFTRQERSHHSHLRPSECRAASCGQTLSCTNGMQKADVHLCGSIIALHVVIRLTMHRRKPVLATTQSSHPETYVKVITAHSAAWEGGRSAPCSLINLLLLGPSTGVCHHSRFRRHGVSTRASSV